MTPRARGLAAASVLLVSLAAASSAFGHASISPPVAQSKILQHFVLAVPTEKEGATTTTIVLTVPDGFAIDSFQASPGWRRTVKATGSGEEQTIQQVTWSGGRTPTDVDSVFGFVASASDNKTYTFDVRQTYSDGSVVNWNGDESSDSPAPLVEAVSSLGGGGGSNTLGIIGIVVGTVGVAIGSIALLSGRRSLT